MYGSPTVGQLREMARRVRERQFEDAERLEYQLKVTNAEASATQSPRGEERSTSVHE